MSNHYYRSNLECVVSLYKQGLKDAAIDVLIEAFSEFEHQKRDICDNFIRMEIEFQKKNNIINILYRW